MDRKTQMRRIGRILAVGIMLWGMGYLFNPRFSALHDFIRWDVIWGAERFYYYHTDEEFREWCDMLDRSAAANAGIPSRTEISARHRLWLEKLLTWAGVAEVDEIRQRLVSDRSNGDIYLVRSHYVDGFLEDEYWLMWEAERDYVKDDVLVLELDEGPMVIVLPDEDEMWKNAKKRG